MVWAKTSRVGCGVTAYRSGRFNAHLYVCNYGESGNVINLPVYRIGAACDDCRGTCSAEYPSLCTAPQSNGSPAAATDAIGGHNNNNNGGGAAVNFGSQPAASSSSGEECKSLVCMINKPVKMMGEGGMQLAHTAMNTVDFVARPVNSLVTGGLDLVARPFGLAGFRPFRFPSAFRFTSAGK
jgi:hypothetical protein